MDYCQRSVKILTNKAALLEFLNDKSLDTHSHFNRCEKCRNLFEQKVSIALSDEEIDIALINDYQKTLENLTSQWTTLAEIQLKKNKWDEQRSKHKMYALFRELSHGYIIPRSLLPAAAGTTDELRDIPQDILKEIGIKEDISIICKYFAEGYEIYVQGHELVKLTLIFFKEDQELLRIKIDEQLPEKLVSPSVIRGWTHINVLKG